MIGGTALVGPHLIRELASQPDSRIWTLTRSGKPYFCETSLQGDRDDETNLIRAIETSQPDIIIDMIPFTAANSSILVSAASKSRTTARLVAVSSIDVYSAFGRIHGTEEASFQPSPISEGMALRVSLGPEGAAYDKIGVENILREGFENTTVLRLPAIYGWPDTTRVQEYLDQMLDGVSKIELSEDRASFRFSRCLHKNAAFAIFLATQSSDVGSATYNVAEAITYSELEWAKRIASFCGWQGDFKIAPWREGAENPRQHLDVATDAIRRDLGFFEKYDVDEGLADTIAFHAYQRLGRRYRKYY